MFDFQLKLSDLTFTGTALDRPECVLATAKGDLFTSDARGGVVHIRPDGMQQLIAGSIPGGGKLHPNGFAMLRDGSFLLANRGDVVMHGQWSNPVCAYLDGDPIVTAGCTHSNPMAR